MNAYERTAWEQVCRWKSGILRPSGTWHRWSKQAQNKVNSMIPEKAHALLTESIKKMVQATLLGSEYTTSTKAVQHLQLEDKEKLVLDKLNSYRKTAAVEGAGTGAGGIFLGLVDFPLLLSIKMKFLFETASLYGYNVQIYEERLFILHIFQLAFSSDEYRKKMLIKVEQWDNLTDNHEEPDWRKLQQEYRDYIDLVKMLQLLPGIGAAVGAYANYNLIDRLGDNAMNAYRTRLLRKKSP